MRIPDDLASRDGGGSILLVVMDGLGGLPHPDHGETELEVARTPNLDALAARSSLGMSIPIGHGITPGSGPAHLALFGYDPLEYLIGRGVLSALGVGFDLAPGDVAVRLNLATLDREGRVVDRRAGRPSDAEGVRIVTRLVDEVSLDGAAELFLVHEKEHRAVLVLRAPGLGAEVLDTDPQETGVPPLEPEARSPGSMGTARLVAKFIERSHAALRNEQRINGLLARGFARYDPFPTIGDRFGLEGVAVAAYPMYRGVARLVGMRVPGAPRTDGEAVALLTGHFSRSAFHFLHFKAPDAKGEDGDFGAKVAAIEAVDRMVPSLTALSPDVLIVTGDHSTPATMKGHSWHHVPVLLSSRWARPTGDEFSERACRGGDLGSLEARHLMSLALAHAGRLSKLGA